MEVVFYMYKIDLVFGERQRILNPFYEFEIVDGIGRK